MRNIWYFCNAIYVIGSADRRNSRWSGCCFIEPWLSEPEISEKARFTDKKKKAVSPFKNLPWEVSSQWEPVELQMLRLGSLSLIRFSLALTENYQQKFPTGDNKKNQYKIYALCYLILQKKIFLLLKRRQIWFSVRDTIWLWCIGLKTAMEHHSRNDPLQNNDQLSSVISSSHLLNHIWCDYIPSGRIMKENGKYVFQ